MTDAKQSPSDAPIVEGDPKVKLELSSANRQLLEGTLLGPPKTAWRLTSEKTWGLESAAFQVAGVMEDEDDPQVVKISNSTTVPISQQEIQRLRLQTWIATLSKLKSVKEPAALRSSIKAELGTIKQGLTQGLRRVRASQLPLEKAWSELAAFFATASTTSRVRHLQVVNLKAADLATNAELRREFFSKILKETTLSPRFMDALLVLPGLASGNKQLDIATLEAFGEAAAVRRALVITDIPDYEALQAAHDAFAEGRRNFTLKGPEPWRHRILLAGPALRIRLDGPYDQDESLSPSTPDGLDGPEDNRPGLFVSAAAVLGGLIYRNDDEGTLCVPCASDGKKIEIRTRDGSPLVPRVSISDTEQLKPFRRSFMPIVWRDRAFLTFWDVETLGTTDESQYQIRRVKDYIQKVFLSEILKNTFSFNESGSRDRLQKTLQRFLDNNSGDTDEKKIKKGTVKVAPVAGQPSRLKIDVEITYKHVWTKAELRVHTALEIVQENGKTEMKES